MLEDGLFDGFETSAAIDRLLFLIYPDGTAAARIAQLAPKLRLKNGLRGLPLADDRFHITLQHLGDHAGLPTDMVVAARQAARTLTTQPFEVTFDRAASFGGKSGNLPFVLRGEALDALLAFNSALATAMTLTGKRLGKWAKPQFTPHVTLLYDDKSVAEQAIEPVSWTVREFVLVHSLQGQTRHVVLDRWTLGG
jgi:RNA 2',3'-cyclic 3'-phosphodiesterase